MLVLVFLALGVSLSTGASAQLQFRVIKEWKYANYTWPSDEDLRAATASGAYVPERCIMSGLGYYNGYYYVTTPRMYDGVPATLSRVREGGNTAPLLEPFPSWEKNRVGDCEALQNVQNIEADAEGFLYVIDSGRTNTMGQQTHNLCPAKLVKYDLNTPDGEHAAKEVFRYEFPESVAAIHINFLYELVLDNHYVYVSDNSAQQPGLIVFSELEMKSWKIQHGTFRADRNATKFNVSGTVLQPELNLAGLALGPETPDGRLLYYAPLSSYNLFAVNTRDLKNPATKTLKNVRNVGRKASQSDGMIMDDRGVLYFGELGTSGIVRWDTNQSAAYRPKLIAQDPTYVQWPNSFTFNDAGDLIVLCNTLVKFITHRADLNEPNFRLLAGNVGASSYVHSRTPYGQYDEHADQVHFHPAGPSTPGIESRMNAMDEMDVNDLLIHNDIEYERNAAAAAARSVSAGWLLFFACSWMLLARNLGFHN